MLEPLIQVANQVGVLFLGDVFGGYDQSSLFNLGSWLQTATLLSKLGPSSKLIIPQPQGTGNPYGFTG